MGRPVPVKARQGDIRAARDVRAPEAPTAMRAVEHGITVDCDVLKMADRIQTNDATVRMLAAIASLDPRAWVATLNRTNGGEREKELNKLIVSPRCARPNGYFVPA